MPSLSESRKTELASPAESNDATTRLAGEIRKAMTDCENHSRLLVNHAIRLGELLLQAKKAVGHGEFSRWLEENCHIKTRQAQRYMKVARRRECFENPNASRATHLTLRAALVALDKELGKDAEESAEQHKSRENPDIDCRDEISKHGKRCRDFKSFRRDETSIPGGPELKQAIAKGMDLFVHDVIKVARRHGRRLTTKELRSTETDQDLVAMALVAEATARLDPLKDFAPRKPTE